MDNNQKLAKIFDEIADALEFLGENPFKVRAYRTAARILEGLDKDISWYIEHDKQIKGIGTSLRAKIKEFLETGKVRKHEELLQKVPKGIFEVMAIPGVGPKTAKILYDEFGVKSIEDLKKVLEDERIYQLRGFGPGKVKNIKEGLELYEKAHSRFPIGFVYQPIMELKDRISKIEGVHRIAVAGSFRRMKETVGDIDILITTDRPAEVGNAIVNLPNIERVLLKGMTKISFIYTLPRDQLIQVDVRIVKDENWGASLMYFTGSKEHNIAVRDIAIEKGYKLNEYGLFKDVHVIASRTEEEIYEALGMQYIPPELRENRGEIEKALRHEIPRLVELKDIKGDLQVHSVYSDGQMTFEEIEKHALELGYQYVAVTDHSYSLKVAGGLEESRLFEKMEKIREFNKKSRVKLLMGAEVEIRMDGTLDYPDEVLKELDIVLASVHNVRKNEDITQRYLRAMESPYVDIIAHPTGRLVTGRKPYPFDEEKVFRTAAERMVLMEINAHANRLDLNDIMIMRAKPYGVKFSLGTDAHGKGNMWMMVLGVGQARRAWLTPEDIVNTLDLDELMDFIKKARKHREKMLRKSRKQ